VEQTRSGCGLEEQVGDARPARRRLRPALSANGDPAIDLGWISWSCAGVLPLRAHPDFQALMMDLAFPCDPFSNDTDADR
jgi:hypothetical protein